MSIFSTTLAFGNEYIWFDDPDGIRLEFYVRKEGE